MRIHLFDLVTSSEHSMLDKLFTVVGIKVGALSEVEELWCIKDFQTGEERECPGCFLTVWKPVSRPHREQPSRYGIMLSEQDKKQG